MPPRACRLVPIRLKAGASLSGQQSPSYRRSDGLKGLWRITCFVVNAKHRRRGVATLARAALEAIWWRGGESLRHFPRNRFMFRAKGFEVVAPFGKNIGVMRKTISGVVCSSTPCARHLAQGS